MRCAAGLLVTTAVACSHGEQIEVPTPRLIFHANDSFEGYPIAEGTPITVQADWAGTCRHERTGIMSIVAAKLGSTYDVPCDEQPFTMEIDCGYPCRIDSDKHDRPIEGHMRVVDFKGDRKFFITPLGERARVFVYLHHGTTTHTYDSPELHVIVPNDFVIECRVQDTPVLCEEPIPAGNDPMIHVRGITALPLGSVKINGRADPDWVRVANLYQQRANGGISPPPRGDYPVVVEVNPYPHTIRRGVTIHVRRDGSSSRKGAGRARRGISFTCYSARSSRESTRRCNPQSSTRDRPQLGSPCSARFTAAAASKARFHRLADGDKNSVVVLADEAVDADRHGAARQSHLRLG